MAELKLADILAARRRIAGTALNTPLIPARALSAKLGHELLLKLDSFQPVGAFKLRGAANAMLLAGRDRLARGVYTASAGNMAQGVAYLAREFGVPCTVVVPDHAPQTKLGFRSMRVGLPASSAVESDGAVSTSHP